MGIKEGWVDVGKRGWIEGMREGELDMKWG